MSALPPTVTLESCLDRFLEALYRGERPPLENFLPPGPERLTTLVELVHADLEFRLKRGEEASVERYLDRFPDLRDQVEPVEELRQAEKKFRELGPIERTPPPLLADTLAALEQVHNTPRRFPSIPGYEVLGELGRGGMSVVYRAWQHKLNRLVALKMARAGEQASPAELLRLFGEARAIARVQHPNIVQIYEIAQHDGLPFLTLELCNAGSLAQYLKGDPLPVEQVVPFMASVARAVHAAHLKGVVHRDLKPGNILLNGESRPTPAEAPDDKGAAWDADSLAARHAPLTHLTPKITDFGLAKRIEVTLNLTDTHEVMGTPQYMAPEQAQGQSRQVGPAADVYALGAVLFEMLTGRPPFKGTTVADIVLQVLHEDAPSLYHLNPRVGRDLATVCSVCLAKTPEKRYATALELAEDLERFQRGEPTWARPAPLWERTLKWGKRHPGFSAACVVAFLFVVVLLGQLIWYTHKLEDAYRQADQEREELRGQLQAKADAARAEASNQAYAADHRVAQQLLRHGELLRLDGVLGRHEAPPVLMGRHGFERRYLETFRPPPRIQWAAHPRAIDILQASRDGRLLSASAAHSESEPRLAHVRLWQPRSDGPPRQLFEAPARSWNPSRPAAGVAPDGRRLAYLAADESLRLVDVTGEPKELHRRDGLVSHPTFNPDGSLLACVENEKRLLLLDGSALDLRADVTLPQPIIQLAFAPDGRGLVVGAGSQVVWYPLVDRKLGAAQVIRTFTGVAGVTAFSPDGRLLVTAGEGAIHVWDLQANGLRSRWGTPPLADVVTALAVSLDGRTLSAGCRDGQLIQWDLHTHQLLAQWRWHGQAVQSLAYLPGEEKLAIGFGNGDVILQPARMPPRFRRLGPTLVCAGPLAWSPDGKLLAVANAHREVWLLEAATGVVRARLGPHLAGVDHLAFSAEQDGALLASAHHFDGRVSIWEASPARLLRTLTPATRGPLRALSTAPNGRLATVAADGRLQLWNARSGGPTTVAGEFIRVAWSPDGAFLAAAGADRVLRLWKADALGEPLTQRTLDRGVTALTFAPDGQTLAALLASGAMHRWRAETGLPVVGEPFGVAAEGDLDGAIEFAPGGDQVLATDSGRDWRSYYLDSGRMHWKGTQVDQPGDQRWVSVRHSPDGKCLALTRSDGTLQVWTLPFFDVLRPPGQVFGAAQALAFTPEGDLLSGHERPHIDVRTEVNNRSVPFFPGRDAIFIQRLREQSTAGMLLWRSEKERQSGADQQPSPLPFPTPSPQPEDGRTVAPCSLVAVAGNLVAGSGEDGSIRLWNRRSGAPVGRLFLTDEVETEALKADLLVRIFTSSRPRFPEAVGRLAFSGDGQSLLAIGRKGSLRVWRRHGDGWRCAGERKLASVAWAGWLKVGEREVAGYTHDSQVHFWDVGSDRDARPALGQPGTGLVCVATSVQGRYLAAATTEHLILVWDLTTGKQRTLIGHRDGIHDLAFSPDGTLASAGQDGTVRLWNVGAGQEVATLEGHTGPVFALAFRSDGRVLASAGATSSGLGEVLFWEGR